MTPVANARSPAVPTPWPRPVDPELPENPLGQHLVTLYSVPEGTKADISWAIHTTHSHADAHANTHPNSNSWT